MTTADNSRHGKMLIAAAVVTLALAAFGFVYVNHSGGEVDMPKELTVEALKAGADNPTEMRQKVHEAFQREDLTDEQRHQLHENIRQVFHEQMDKRMDEYFTAEKTQQVRILDRHLDEMVKFMREHERERDAGNRRNNGGSRAEARSSGGGQGASPEVRPPGGPGGDGPRGWHRDHGPPTQAQRKERSESRDPDAMARRMAYFTALRQRAEQRGIAMPFGPPGRGGPR